MNTLLACQAPIEVLKSNIETAYVMAAVSAAVVSVSLFVEWRRKRFSWFVVYAPLFILHPAWQLAWAAIQNDTRVSADCFSGARGESIFLTAILIAMLSVMVHGGVSKRLFLLRAMVIFWTFYALHFFFIFPLGEILLPDLSHYLMGQIEGTFISDALRGVAHAVILTAVCAILYLLEALRKRKLKGS